MLEELKSFPAHFPTCSLMIMEPRVLDVGEPESSAALASERPGRGLRCTADWWWWEVLHLGCGHSLAGSSCLCHSLLVSRALIGLGREPFSVPANFQSSC